MKPIQLDDERSNPVVVDLAGVVNGRLLAVANSGSGKTTLVRRFLELAAGEVQVLVLDIEGEFAGVRYENGRASLD